MKKMACSDFTTWLSKNLTKVP